MSKIPIEILFVMSGILISYDFWGAENVDGIQS